MRPHTLTSVPHSKRVHSLAALWTAVFAALSAAQSGSSMQSDMETLPARRVWEALDCSIRAPLQLSSARLSQQVSLRMSLPGGLRLAPHAPSPGLHTCLYYYSYNSV